MFYYFSPFFIVYLNHAILVDGTLDVSVIGLIIMVGSIFGVYKFIEKKKNLSEIQDKSKMFIVCWIGIKRVLMTIILWWGLVTIRDNIDRLELTIQLLTVSFTLGFIFNVLGNRK